MELASALSGSRWSDHPDGVDTTLAALARMVNDRTRNADRSRLLPLAPWLIIAPTDGATAARAAMTAVAVRAALAHATGPVADRMTRAAAAIALSREGRSCWQRSREHRRAVRLIRHAVAAVGRQPYGDDGLRRMLIDAVDAARALDGLPPLPSAALQPVGVDRLPVQVRVHIPDVAESRHYHAIALLELWPPSLAQAWAARSAEASPDRTPPRHDLVESLTLRFR